MSSQSQPLTSDASVPPSSDGVEQSHSTTTAQSNPSKPKPENHRLAALEAKKASLEETLEDLKAQRLRLATETKLPSGLPLPTTNPAGEPLDDSEILSSALKSSNAVIKDHIALLHKYNEIKDIGQGLMGLIADQRDCRVVKVMEEFGVAEGD